MLSTRHDWAILFLFLKSLALQDSLAIIFKWNFYSLTILLHTYNLVSIFLHLWFFLQMKVLLSECKWNFWIPIDKVRAYVQHQKFQRTKECLIENGIYKGQRSQDSLLVAKTCDRPMGSFKAAMMIHLPSSQMLLLDNLFLWFGIQVLCLPFKSNRRSHRI